MTLDEADYHQMIQECLNKALRNGLSRMEVEPAKPKLTSGRKAIKAVRRTRKNKRTSK